jgi:co-chaperonin GroES (HSP10)
MLTPLGPHFLIKIVKQEQKDRKGKIGSILIPETHVYMGREVQAGEIVAIGPEAAMDFPDAKIGHTLLIHHFTTGKVSEGTHDGTYLIDQDETFNYYMVTTRSDSGRGNECYGVYDGSKITPHPDYIFLETEKREDPTHYDKFIDQSTTTTSSGLLVFKKWEESREDVTETNKRIQERIKSLSNIGTGITDEIKREIYDLEREMENNTKKSGKKRYEPYRVSAVNPIVDDWFNCKIKKGDTVYCLNIASRTTIEFMKTEYRVVKIGYIAFPHNYLKKAVEEFKSRSLKTA